MNYSNDKKRITKTAAVKKVIACVLLVCMCFTLCSCSKESGKPEIKVPGKKEETLTAYSARQMLALIRSQQTKVTDVYTDQIFTVLMDDQNKTYADTFLGIMKDYIIKLTTMADMADDRGIVLTESENDKIKKCAQDYVQKMESNENSVGLSVEEVEKLISDQVKVKRLRKQIVDESDIEISESEARVADLQRIIVDSTDDAARVMNEINEGGDFLMIARANSIDAEIELKASKIQLDPSMADAVFALEDGEVSAILTCGDKYYIFRCEKGYDEEATSGMKEQIAEKRGNLAISSEYALYAADHEHTIDDADWTIAVRLFSSKAEADSIFDLLEETKL